jgi:ATP-dependent RNA helicase RhlB
MKNFFKKIATKIASKKPEEASAAEKRTVSNKPDAPAQGEIWQPGKGSTPAPAGKPAGHEPRAKKEQADREPRPRRPRRSSPKPDSTAGQGDRENPAKSEQDKSERQEPSRDSRRQSGQNRSSQGRRGKPDSSRRDDARPSRPSGRRERPSQPTESSDPIAPPSRPELNYNPDAFPVEPQEGKTRFQDLDLCDELMMAIQDLKFTYCTPIQAESLPFALQGKDVTGKAQTGTGKTAAFLIACYNRFMRNPIEGKRVPGSPRALIIAPTRELVIQIEKDALDLGKYCPPNVVAVYGGTGFNQQMERLQKSVIDIVVATPGRLLQFNRDRVINLKQVEVLVLDEADRMLDMGFIPDVRTIIRALPPVSRRQNFFYSATINQTVISLAREWTNDPVKVEVEPEQVAVDTVEQKVFTVSTRDKTSLLYNLIAQQKLERLLVFVNRRDRCERVYETLKHNDIDCDVLSGAIPQNKRSRILEDFRAGKLKVLIATDVAGRGLHIDGLNYVVNYDIPYNAEEYVHRIGRTGRAGMEGTSFTFACEEESFGLMDIEEYIGKSLKCEQPPEEWLARPPNGFGRRAPRQPSANQGGNRGSGNRGRSNRGRSSQGRGGQSRGPRKPPASS